MLAKKAIYILTGLLLFFFITTSVSAGDEQLYGTWRLVSYKRMILATGETTDFFGKSPQGFLNYDRDGRMLVVGPAITAQTC